MKEHSYLVDPSLFSPKDIEDWEVNKKPALFKSSSAKLPFGQRFNASRDAEIKLWSWLDGENLLTREVADEVLALTKGFSFPSELEQQKVLESDEALELLEGGLEKEASNFILQAADVFSLQCVMLYTELSFPEGQVCLESIGGPVVLFLAPSSDISVGALDLLIHRARTGLDSCISFLTEIDTLFPNARFSRQFLQDAKTYVGTDPSKLAELFSHLSLLSKYAVSILSGNGDIRRKQADFKSVGLEASPENGKVKQSKKHAKWRMCHFENMHTEESKGGESKITCNWHTKSYSPAMRLHFAVENDILFVGRVAVHGPIPR